MTHETYTVVGMTCDHCARSVTQEVSAVDGVTDVQVDLATGLVNVTTAQPVPVAAVQAAVEEAGYTLAS
ncbi:MAG TPA: heavy-metal-associated domain-containing protein [Acidimicrobiales bacterium]|nr:heavy-metal-associated domain-containing protein [Acidimicrobiales bacterium]